MEVTIENYNPWKGSFFGGIVLVLVGVLFLALGNDALKWVMIIAGVLVLISGLIALVDAAKAHGGTMSLLAGGIQVIIGVVLIVAASLWVDLLMIILGAVLLVIGLVSLVQLKSGPSTTSSKVVRLCTSNNQPCQGVGTSSRGFTLQKVSSSWAKINEGVRKPMSENIIGLVGASQATRAKRK